MIGLVRPGAIHPTPRSQQSPGRGCRRRGGGDVKNIMIGFNGETTLAGQRGAGADPAAFGGTFSLGGDKEDPPLSLSSGAEANKNTPGCQPRTPTHTANLLIPFTTCIKKQYYRHKESFVIATPSFFSDSATVIKPRRLFSIPV